MQHLYLANLKIKRMYGDIIAALLVIANDDNPQTTKHRKKAKTLIDQLQDPIVIHRVLILEQVGDVMLALNKVMDCTELLVCEIQSDVTRSLASLDSLSERRSSAELKAMTCLDLTCNRWGFSPDHMFDIQTKLSIVTNSNTRPDDTLPRPATRKRSGQIHQLYLCHITIHPISVASPTALLPPNRCRQYHQRFWFPSHQNLCRSPSPSRNQG